MIGHYEKPINDTRLELVDVCLPLVSIIVTNYNYEKYILQCLKSIAKQTYSNYECIVVDDCSSDDSINIINNFIFSPESKGRFTLLRHAKNLGQMAAFKTGLQHSKGSFVVFVDADDIIFQDFLYGHLRAHLGGKVVAFTSSNQYQINANNEIIAGNHEDLRTKNKIKHVSYKSFHYPYWTWATTSSMMFRRAILDLIMPEDTEKYKICADNYICHFANLIGGSLLIPDIYGCYRRHGKNFFSSNPILGGNLPTGNLDNHPSHNTVRLGILKHLLKNYEVFISVLSINFLFIILLMITGPFEILKLSYYHSDFIKKTKFPLFRFFFISLMFQFKIKIYRYLSYFKLLLSKKNVSILQ